MSEPAERSGLLDLPIAPICLGLAFLIADYLDAAISPFAAARGVLIGMAIVIAITAAAWVVLRRFHAVTLVAAMAVGALVLPGMAEQASRFVASLADRAPLPVSVGMLAGFMAAGGLLVWIVWQRARRPDGLRSIARATNAFGLLLVIVVVANGALGGGVEQAAHDMQQGRGCLCPPAASSASAEAQPDVIVLLLDGYARADALERQFAFDNQPFLDALRARGFEVAEQAQSDYLWTHSTLASMLNMRLVEDIPALDGVLVGREAQYPAVRNVINDNAVFEAFRSRGYDVIATASGYERTSLRQADAYLDAGQMNEWEYGLLRSTLVGGVLRLVNPDFAATQHRDRIRSEFELLDKLASSDGSMPTLALAHVPAPHLPAVFHADGRPRHEPMTSWFYADSAEERGEPVGEVAAAYREQLEYLNTLVIGSIDRLIDQRPNAIVIVMSDHGAAVHIDWDNPDRETLVERTGVLFAARTPGYDGLFEDDHRLVDTFSVLLARLRE